MEISLLYDKERNIYFKTIKGVIQYDILTESLQDISPFDLKKNTYLVVDITNAKFGFPLKKLSAFINQSQQELPGEALVFHAIITKSRAIKSFVKIIRSLLSNHRYHFSISPSREHAINWIQEKQKIYGATILP